MFPLRKKHEAAPVEITLTVANSASLEGYVESLRAEYPHVQFGLAPALETQQLDNSAAKAAEEEAEETIAKYAADHPHTGPLAVFMLDGKGAGSMDEEGDGAMRAMISSALLNPLRTVACLIPEDVKVTTPDDISPATMLRQMVDTVLSTEGITVIVGRAATESFLADPDGYMDGLRPSTEGLGTAALIGAIVGSVVGLNKLKQMKKAKKAVKNSSTLASGVFTYENDCTEKLRDTVTDTYASPEWRSTHPVKPGMVSAAGIAEALSKQGHFPQDAVAGVVHDAAQIKQMLAKASALIDPYLKDLEKLGQEALSLNANDSVAAAKDLLVDGLKTLKRPEDRGVLPMPVLINGAVYTHRDWNSAGHITIDHTHGLPDTIPAMTQKQFDVAAKLLVDLFITSVDGFEAWRDAVFYMVPDHHRNLMARLLPEIDDTHLYEQMGDEYGYDHDGYAGGPRAYQCYLYKYIAQFGEEIEALVLWMNRSVDSSRSSMEGLEPSTEGAGADVLMIIGASVVASVVARLIGRALVGLGKLLMMPFRERSPEVKKKIGSEIDVIEEQINLSFLFPEWMDNRRFYTGSIDGSGIANRLAIHGRPPTAETIVAGVRSHIAASARLIDWYVHVMGPYITAMNHIADGLKRDSHRSDFDVKSAIATAEAAVEKLGKPWTALPVQADHLLGHATFSYDATHDENSLEFANEEHHGLITALTKINSPVVADVLIDALEALRDYQDKYSKVPHLADGEDSDHFDAKLPGDPNNTLWDAMQAPSDLSTYYWHSNAQHRYQFVLWEMETSLLSVAKGLKLWLERSVK
jgi:hypothetical protein